MVRAGAPWTCSVWAIAFRTGAGAGAEAPKAVGRMIAIATRAITARALSGKRSGSRCTTPGFASRPRSPSAGAERPACRLDRGAVRGQRHVDVAARRVRVRAHFVGLADEVGGRVALDRRQRHVELNREDEGALRPRVERDL